MSKIVIGVHGLSNKPPADILYDDGWVKAIQEGLLKNQGVADKSFEFEGVYWAKLNYPEPKTDADIYRPAEPVAIRSYNDSRVDDLVRHVEDAGGKLFDWLKSTFDINRAAEKALEWS